MEFSESGKLPSFSPFQQISSSNEAHVIQEIVSLCKASLSRFPGSLEVSSFLGLICKGRQASAEA